MIPATPPPEFQPLTLECVVQVSRQYQLPLEIMLGLLAQEGGRLGDKLHRHDGSYDFGPMQVNSFWLPKVAPYGVSENHLRWHGCYNVAVGGWILRYEQGRAGGDIWRAVGRYYTPSKPALATAYMRRVADKIRALASGRLTLTGILRHANGGRG